MSILDGYGGGPGYSPPQSQSLRPSHMHDEHAYHMPGNDELMILINRLTADALAIVRAAISVCQEELDEHMVESISGDQEIEEIWTERWVDAAELVALGREILAQTNNQKNVVRGRCEIFGEARQTIAYIQDTWNDIVGAVQVEYAQQLVQRPESIKIYRDRMLTLKHFRTTVEEQLQHFDSTNNSSTKANAANIVELTQVMNQENSDNIDLTELLDCSRRLCNAMEVCAQAESACRKIEGTVVSNLGHLRNRAHNLDIEV